MVRIIITACLLSCVISCGAPDCAITDRDGLYMVTYDWVSGNCNRDLPGGLVRLDGTDALPGCTASLSEWSDDSCRRDTDMACVSNDGTTTRSVVYTEQTDDDGAHIEGRATLTLTNTANGAVICTGTYDIKAERQ